MLAGLAHVLAAGPPALDTIRRLPSRDGTSVQPADFGPAVPSHLASCAWA